ncbi:hypothetical protein BBF96_01940 [Anoxybacter fermentans]|uniref:Sporulation stage II protein D amidase enhancer LytB N-terminal domain-containing protein n=1 Tax=Anoxybacter fermentans TaxID=1323375 RepID=A0A3S9SVC4_9FIRM|nr:SpoIID/LytB domain-containing protein [Anoxybacter fermentans]AZR72266.1 hypothetical protein BBF96_01940 [Anoxybacter fermentans]
MSNFFKKFSLYIGLSLVAFLGLTFIVQASDQLMHPFFDEVEALIALKVLPGTDWKPEDPVTYRDYVSFGEKLINGRAKDVILSNLTDKLVNPEAVITYQDALKYASLFLGLSDETGIAKIKEITGELKKTDTDRINGYEMAYIFYNLLYSKRKGESRTVLEERYILGEREIIASKIMQITNDQIILEDEGALPLAKDVQAFLIKDNIVTPLGFSRVSVGMSDLKFLFNKEGQVKTIILPDLDFPENIRVLISQELSEWGSSKSYDFAEIKIKAEQPFKIITHKKGEDIINFVTEQDEIITFTNQDGQIQVTVGNYNELINDRVYIKSFYPHNLQFEVLSTIRKGKNPVYAGHMEIIPSEKAGYLYLINELPIEMYLRKVVPSEIPFSWGKEAFKVQAIAARSYAISQIQMGRFESKSANVDDSTASQVYNNCDESTLVNEAIDETRGIVPMYDGEVIDAVFFSTSAGYTANNEDVWHYYRTKEFPGKPIPYLRARSQIINKNVPDLTKEENALAFFKDQTLESFDAVSPYYRWRIELTREELENTINKNLPARERADGILKTDFIQTLTGIPVDPENPDFSIGTLKDLKVVRRGEGGNIMVLDIIGTNGTYRVMKEYNIRFVIRPQKDMTGSKEDVILHRYDGSVYRNYSILPSAFAAFEIERDEQGEITKVTIYGGGNGHGVGMSQWGVKGMVDMGYTYDQILKNYYTGIELKKIY